MTSIWTKESWDEACGFHDSEEYIVAAIKKHLRTPAQKAQMDKADVTIEDVLNGRIEGGSPDWVQVMYDDWNIKLGWKEFGF